MIDAKVKATNIVWHHAQVIKAQREAVLNQRGGSIWLTGLPSSGKSTTAYALEYELFENGFVAYVLDGDNVRHGLNKDLGFSAKGRAENIRRVAEVAKLFCDAGILTITSFISPYRAERDFARQIHREAGHHFAEIYIDTPIGICEARDPKGLFAKARRGELKGFTGVDDPYEPPLAPEFTCRTADCPPREIAAQIMEFLVGAGFLPARSKFCSDVQVPAWVGKQLGAT